EKGAFSAVLTKLDKFLNGEKEFTVSSPSTVAGVRGTVFFMKVEDENNTYLCICNGAIVADRTESELDMQADHHKAYRFTKEGDIVTSEPAELLYHNDEMIERVAGKINYTIPWGEGEYSY
ncbi:MAG: hypothetical protein JEY91_15980, partial [Spirochaetaceae bacterium]|nr:hypothetical protein [Spirochaetaceae bacterium]